MRNLLAFAAAAVLTFAGLGWYLDWYQIRSTMSSGGHQNINIDVNGSKVLNDVEKAKETWQQKRDRSRAANASASSDLTPVDGTVQIPSPQTPVAQQGRLPLPEGTIVP